MTLATEAGQISNIAFGYMGSKALFTALELELFTILTEGPRTTEALAKDLKIPADALATLLTALCGLGLIASTDEGWVNAPASDAFLVKGAKYDFGDYLRLQVGRQMYGLMDQIEGVVRGKPDEDGTNSYADWFSDAAEARLYSESQHAGSLGPARQLAKMVDLSAAKTLLDVGGGTGAFATTLCTRFPNLKATVVDFPNVAALGERYVAEAGLSDRIRYVAGDGRDDIWPKGQDVILMSYLLSGVPGDAHDALFARAHDHLAPGGTLLVHDFVVEADRTGPTLAALWQLQHLAFTPGGRSHCCASLTDALTGAGFRDVSVESMIPDMTMLAQGRRAPQ